jgi:hypothetical protein
LNNEQIRALKYASDLFERDSEVNRLIDLNLIYPIVMQSIKTGQRIMMAPGGNIRELQKVFFTGM